MIYFDTNGLKASGWPKSSAALDRLIKLAQILKITCFLPQPVETELEELWMREWVAARDALLNAERDLKKKSEGIVEIHGVITSPTAEDARAAYRRVASARMRELGIVSVTTTTQAVQKFVEMAAARTPPFKDKDVGFRDAVIVATIVDHRAALGGGACVVVSGDAALTSKAIEEAAQRLGVTLKVHKTVNEAVDALRGTLVEAVSAVVEADQGRARAALERERPAIEQQIVERLVISERDLWQVVGTILRWDRLELGAITTVRTPIPSPPSDARVTLSFDAAIKLHVRIERYPTPAVRQLKIGEERTSPVLEALTGGAVPVQTQEVIERQAEIEATAQRTAAGEYRDINVEGARLRGSIGELPGLGDLARLVGNT